MNSLNMNNDVHSFSADESELWKHQNNQQMSFKQRASGSSLESVTGWFINKSLINKGNMMSDQNERERFKSTEEEFIGDGLSRKDGDDSSRDLKNSNQTDYEKRSIEDLRHEAREKDISGFKEMSREQLIKALKKV